MEIIYQVEKDPYCQKVLAKHWPGVPCYGDIKEIDFSTLPPVDLICGGFPCQPVSCAGKRQGDKDERWIWPEFYRAICEARPGWVLVENVPGLLSASNGRLFGGILGDLARGGYDAEWDLLPAAAFGAPHLRFRLFLVAHARSCSGIGGPLKPGREAEGGIAPGGYGEDVPDSAKSRCRERRPQKGREIWNETWGPESERRNIDVQDPVRQGRNGQRAIFAGEEDRTGAHSQPTRSDWWKFEPDVGGTFDGLPAWLDGFSNSWGPEWENGFARVAHKISKRMDRLKCLGNAVVPQVAEFIGRRIMECHLAHIQEQDCSGGMESE